MLFHRLLLDGADRHPDRPAFTWVDRNRTMTYEEAATEMDQVAGALASLGVSRLDRVGVFAYNGLDYLLAMFGAWRLGAISALVNVQYADTLDYFVNDATPSVLIYTHDQLPAIERHRPALPSVEHYICLDGPQPGALSWPDLLEGASAPPPDVTREDDPAHLSYTSGTSGRPKGALLAHEPTTRATNCIAERLRIDSSDVLFGPTALSSSYQLVANLLPGLHRGCHVHVMGKWEAASGWQALDTARATVFAANPTLLTDVLVQSRALRRVPCAVRVGLSGGGPVPPSLKRAWRDELCLPLVESYGQSELGGFVALGQPKLVDSAHLSAIGRALPDKEVRILDDDDREVPIGETGQICIRGGFMVGYWGRPEQTAEVTRSGWLHTGDVGRMDEDGAITLRGRLSERVIVAGEVWFPRDVEEALLAHPAVRQAALVGLPDANFGQRPVAYVTLLTPAMPADLVAEAAISIGRPLDMLSIVIVRDLPMTPTGKVSKAQLVEQALADASSEVR